MQERIAINPKVCHGQACVRGTRIPVHQVFRMLANGDSVDSLLRAYPSLQRGDILACFDYAASLAEEEVTPLETAGAEFQRAPKRLFRISGPPNRDAGTAPVLLPQEHRELHPGLDHVRHTAQ